MRFGITGIHNLPKLTLKRLVNGDDLTVEQSVRVARSAVYGGDPLLKTNQVKADRIFILPAYVYL